MTANQVGFAILVLGLALLIGKLVRLRVRWVQRLFLPSAVVGGFIMLFLGPHVFGAIAGGRWAEAGVFTPEILAAARPLPGVLISVVFATMFLGQNLPSRKRALRVVGPQLSFGVALGSAQYVIGILLTVFLLMPVFDVPAVMGSLIEIAFEGGHGTAAGMRPVFEEIGFPEGGDLTVGLATLSLVCGILFGTALINWAVRTGRTEFLKGSATASIEEQRGLYRLNDNTLSADLRPKAKSMTHPSSVEGFSLAVGIVSLAIFIGWLMLEALRWIESVTIANITLADGVQFELMRYVPLFPMALLGGVIVQLGARKLGIDYLINYKMMLRVQGFALDFLVVAAIGTLSLQAIGDNLGPFILLALAGIAINFFNFFWLAPRLMGWYWFERAIADYGQSMGVTATGMMLLRMVDPEMKSPAYEAFGVKQLLFEPFFGGGLFTALSVPTIFVFGPWPWLIGMAVIYAVSVIWGLKKFGPIARREHAERAAGKPTPSAEALLG